MENKGNTEVAIFAGGCFWSVEHYMQHYPGVITTESGYIGGSLPNPTYEQVKTGTTGHAEAVKVIFDLSIVSYEGLAKFFFEIHDPTQVDRQGADVGPQYRSEIFYISPEQKETAEKLIAILKKRGYMVATKVTPATKFYPAEDYHQNYVAKTGKEPCGTITKRFN